VICRPNARGKGKATEAPYTEQSTGKRASFAESLTWTLPTSSTTISDAFPASSAKDEPQQEISVPTQTVGDEPQQEGYVPTQIVGYRAPTSYASTFTSATTDHHTTGGESPPSTHPPTTLRKSRSLPDIVHHTPYTRNNRGKGRKSTGMSRSHTSSGLLQPFLSTEQTHEEERLLLDSCYISDLLYGVVCFAQISTRGCYWDSRWCWG
jgi:hypothetical protein